MIFLNQFSHINNVFYFHHLTFLYSPISYPNKAAYIYFKLLNSYLYILDFIEERPMRNSYLIAVMLSNIFLSQAHAKNDDVAQSSEYISSGAEAGIVSIDAIQEAALEAENVDFDISTSTAASDAAAAAADAAEAAEREAQATEKPSKSK
ncbi:hypothetical protein [Acinetobacter sp. AS167]|uniref:hypothetical protein n=2 Tax=unclassified Acinetobacter TaxID=196816 RepID=UPI003015EB58